MLKTILSVSGKPGLYKLVSNGKNMVIVESLTDHKRLPIHARDKVVSLGDIAMYTNSGEVPLKDVLTAIKKKENGGKTSIPHTAKPEELKKYLSEVLPDYDKERIYNADIKKLISWYNLLIDANIDFELEEKKDEENEVVEEKSEATEIKEEKPAEKKTKKTTSKKKEKED
jgi:hypothetical protein